MTIQYEIGIKDMAALSVYQWRKSYSRARGRPFARVSITLLLLLCAHVSLASGYAAAAAVFALAAVVWLALYKVLQEALVRRGVRQLYSLPENACHLGPRQVVLGTDGLDTRLATQTTHIDWDGILGIEEDHDHLFLFVSGVSALIVPRRAFASGDEADRFRQHAENQLGRAA
jgi:hypothetical protein